MKLVCCIKLESYLPYCEGVCQSALKIMHCKLEFTELMKCPQGGYDDPLKERALSDNLSNFEKKKSFIFFFLFSKFCLCVPFWHLRVREHWCLFSVPEPFLLPGAVLLWAGAVFIPAWGHLLPCCGAWAGAGLGCSSLCWGLCRLQPSPDPIPKPPSALCHVLAVLPALQLSPLADALSCLCLTPCLMSVQAVWTWCLSVLARAALIVSVTTQTLCTESIPVQEFPCKAGGGRNFYWTHLEHNLTKNKTDTLQYLVLVLTELCASWNKNHSLYAPI